MKRNVPVSTIMTKDPTTAHTDQKLSTVHKALAEGGFHHVPVVSGTTLVGMITSTDLLRVTYDYGVDSRMNDAVLDAMGNQVLDLADMVSPYPVLVRSLQLPYADGTATVVRLVRTKGWSAVDALYERLPESTEQMLHIDKLLAREAPIAAKMDVGVLERLLPGVELLWHDTLGEHDTAALGHGAEDRRIGGR